jgi:hypothetical protein
MMRADNVKRVRRQTGDMSGEFRSGTCPQAGLKRWSSSNVGPTTRGKLVTMKVVTYEAVVDGGEVKLPARVRLPEHAKVYVVVPGVEELPSFTIHTPHLLRLEQVAGFAMEIVEREDATVR